MKHQQLETLMDLWYMTSDPTEEIRLETLIRELQEKELSEIIHNLTKEN